MVESHRLYDETRKDGKGGYQSFGASSQNYHSGTLYKDCCRSLQDTTCARNFARLKNSCSQTTTRKIIVNLGYRFTGVNLSSTVDATPIALNSNKISRPFAGRLILLLREIFSICFICFSYLYPQHSQF